MGTLCQIQLERTLLGPQDHQLFADPYPGSNHHHHSRAIARVVLCLLLSLLSQSSTKPRRNRFLDTSRFSSEAHQKSSIANQCAHRGPLFLDQRMFVYVKHTPISWTHAFAGFLVVARIHIASNDGVLSGSKFATF